MPTSGHAPKLFKLVGTQSGDDLAGTDRADVIYAKGGNDFVLAGGGNDIVHGGNGNDFLSGDDGNDIIFGGNGDDVLYGSGFNGTGSGGVNYLYGGNGNDSFNELYFLDASEFNFINGGHGSDTYHLWHGYTAVADAAGFVHVDNRAIVTNVENWLTAESNPGNSGVHVDLRTLDYDLTIRGGFADDTISAGSGNDLIDGRGGSDFIDGGQGIDTARFEGSVNDYIFGRNGSGQVTVTSLQAPEYPNTVPDVDTLVSIELLQFGDGTFTASDLVNLSKQQPTNYFD
jgi:Ca2+-binding RTX toxin-like protein